ncbi:MAG: cyclic nucleotide-binding domain-containing protein [Hahellaceae bacterium]|nr:cyclic nucleotide-binding domain-containing protein [Hahellaceae bacterium]MCP5169758.1 cyclic nucleotide-binding domain-containing protein [Hahellaceae bacterium]
MIVKSDPGGVFLSVDNRCKQLLQAVLEDLVFPLPAIREDYIEDLYEEDFADGCVFLVKEGVIGHEQDGTFLFEFDVGDLVGLQRSQGGPKHRYFAELPVVLIPISRSELFDGIFSDPDKACQWSEFLLADNQRLTSALALSAPEVDRSTLGMQSFSAGETIIREGDNADSVFTIIEGHAEVFAHGVKVGEIQENEIFGALSLLTNQKRTATVVADKRCMVMVVPKDQFEVMIRSHSHICLSLMENMARQIVAMNERITSE